METKRNVNGTNDKSFGELRHYKKWSKPFTEGECRHL